jgi:hypothetical protein
VNGRGFTRLVLAAFFVSQFVLLDIALGGARSWLERPGSLRAAFASIAIWTALLVLGRASRLVRGVVAALAATLIVLQVLVYRVVHVPLDLQVAESARHMFGVIRSVLVRMAPGAAVAIAIVLAVEVVLLRSLRGRSTRRVRLALVLVAIFAVWMGPEPRLATPEVRAAHALVVLRHRRPPPPMAGAIMLPPLHSTRREMPEMLFVLTESVRSADWVASGPEATAPASVEVTPDRFELDELRAISSYTAVSLSALITGRTQEGRREDILEAANLFDFAHAASADVGYYSAQSRETFETKDVRAAVDHFVTLETLAGHDVDDDAEWVVKPLDRMIVDRFVFELAARPRPSVTVLHLYGTHAPYYFEDATARFTPFERAVGWAGMPKLRNAYRNAIVEQDRQIARAIRAFVAHAGERPWLVVFTSDHGESFGEHSAIHHGQNLYDEQVHVPGFIAVGNGALTDDERRALAEHRGRFVTHLDLLPTMLDALGLLDNFSVKGHAERMSGHSLLRPHRPRDPVPVTNCTLMFPCPLNTWGLFGEDHKLVAQVWDAGWRCLGASGGEHDVPMSDPACVKLNEASRRHFPLLPNGAPNR